MTAQNLADKFQEIQNLCARVNDGPLDEYEGPNVEVKLRDCTLSSDRNFDNPELVSYTLDSHDQEGKRVFETFKLRDKQLEYGRREMIDGLSTMKTEWTLGSDGFLTTIQGFVKNKLTGKNSCLIRSCNNRPLNDRQFTQRRDVIHFREFIIGQYGQLGISVLY